MKIMVLSLLRLGDALQHLQMFEQLLKEKNWRPSEVLWIVDESSAPLRKLLPPEWQIAIFPRRQLQDILVQRQASVFRAVHIFDQWRQQFGASCDLLINFTHTKLSFKMAGFINADHKLGFDLKNKWVDYMNRLAETSKLPMLPYFQLQAMAMDFDIKLQAAVWPSSLKKVSIHCCTSDAQKEWPVENWRLLITELQKQFQGLQVTLLGAPSEEAALRKNFEDFQVNFLCADLKQTRQQLQQTDLLIGVDSAMLHLAALDNVPSLGLFLGSAEIEKITPLSLSTEILQNKTESMLTVEQVLGTLILKAQKCATRTKRLTSIGPVFSVLTEAELRANENWPLLREKLEYNVSRPSVELV